jgi:putative transposase
VKFAFIAAEKATFPVSLLCRTLGVSRPGVYASQTRSPAPRHGADERLGLEIAAIHAESRRRYGRPRIHAELGARGCHTSRKRVARLMRPAVWRPGGAGSSESPLIRATRLRSPRTSWRGS